MSPLRVGFVTCVHPFFDLPAVVSHRDRAAAVIQNAGCEVIAAETPHTTADVPGIASRLRISEIDVLLLFFCTWVAEDITLALAMELADIPMLIWALPFLEKDVPLPSPITGLIASGCNIRLQGRPFAYMIGNVTPARVDHAIRAIRVGSVARRMRRARFAIVGAPCPGMMDVVVDEAKLQMALGVTTIHLSLDVLLKAAREVSPEQTTVLARQFISETGGTRGVSEETLADNLRLYLGMKELVEENRIDAYCVRCWPELRSQHRITVCVTHALMARAGIPSSCEIDLTALITTYLLNHLAGTPAFNFDVTGYLEEEGAIQFAHCGAAELSLAGDPKRALLRPHMRTGTGVTIEFPFKEGIVTLAKLLRPINGTLKLFVARGKVIPSGEGVRGSVATVRLEPSADAFIDKMMREPVEHHIALVYGDWTRDLSLFCDFAGLEYLPLSSMQ